MVQFKLQHRGLVRKVTFKNVDQPSWHELSWKVGDLCNIPHASVALTYLDPDGDKITISSQAELKEYYNSLEEEDLSVPHKFIVRNLNEGVPDDAAFDPREDMFLMRDGQTMAASTVGGGSQWGFNPEDEAERDPTKLRLSGYSTFADALSPLARSAGGTDLEDASSPEKEDLPGGFKPSPSPQPNQNASSTSSWFGAWGKAFGGASDPAPTSAPPPPPPPPPPPAPPVPTEPTKSVPTNSNSNSRLDPNSNPWADGNVTKTPAWAASTTPTSTAKAPSLPWAPPSHVATGTLKGPSRGQPTQQQAQSKFPPPVSATVQMDTMVADRATTYEGSPAVGATVPRGRKHKKKLEKAAKEEEARRAAEVGTNPTGSRFEEMELKAIEREAAREREENARISAEAATRAAVDEQRRHEQHEWERQREPLDNIKIDEKQPRDGHQIHQRGVSDMSHSSEWEHVAEQTPEQEDEQSYQDRIAASRANVFGTSPSNAPTIRQRKSSTKGKDKDRSSGKSSRPNSKVYPPTPAPKKYYDSDLVSDNGQNGAGGSTPATPGVPAPPSTAQVCNDVADLLVSFGRILDNERDLLDAIRETFSSGPYPGALSATFGNRNLSPEMLRIVASVDDLLTRILPSRPAPSPHALTNMELEPRVPTPSVTPTPVVPADPEFNVPKSEFATSFEFANRGRQQGAPIINVPRPKYPASSLTRDGYTTGTTPPSKSSFGYLSTYPTSPDKSSRTRSRSRPPPNDFEIVAPSFLPPQARVVPPPVVPGEETDDSPMTPDASRGFARQSVNEGGLVLANQSQRSTDTTRADMETARQHHKSQRELYKLEKAERKKEMGERAAAKAERKKARAMANNDPKIADLTDQLQGLVPPRPFEAERRYIESPYDGGPRTAGPYPGSQASTVFAEGLGQVTLVPPMGFPGSNSAVTAPVSPVHEDPSTQSFDRARRRRQSLNGGVSPERYSHSRPPTSGGTRTESYHGLQPDAYPGAARHANPYAPPQPQHDLAKRVALKLTEMGYTPHQYPTLPSLLAHRIRPLMNTPGVNENELAYHIVQDLFKYSGHGHA
ncbi:unnamed protein product [Rhizoctonia solani]|uniref:PB1 domain-containing protein n=1 Tax=Rhizoctonia solani TaxID=456999 RepID=A0A8H3AR67_9AGAM|nr:unnamed protein product [Rhizoctonia solani]